MKKIITLVCLCVLPFSYVAAEGYQANAQSTKQSGMGHVGSALKLGSESMHFNPAGLGFLDKTIDISAGFTGVFSTSTYKNDLIKGETDNKPSTPLFLYAGFKVYDNFSAGISLTTPYGSGMNWGKNWAGSHLIQEISLKSFSIQPTLSYRPFERLSIGAGAMIMFGNFSLSRALIPAGGLEGLRPLNPAFGSTLDLFKDIPAVSATLSGDAGVKIGFNIGAMFDVTDRLTVGVSYRSKVKMQVDEGRAVLDYANETVLKGLIETVNPFLPDDKKIFIPALDQGSFKAELPLPSNLNIGVSYKATDRLLLSGEVQIVGWSAYKILSVQFTQEILANQHNIDATKNYKNACAYRIGGQFAATDRLDLRLGAYIDGSPVQDDFFNPETPSMTRLGLTTGFSFRPVNRLSIDCSFGYVTGFGRDGSYSEGLTVPFQGHYNLYALMPSIGISYGF